MLQTLEAENNSTFDDCLEKLYNDPKLNAIVRFLKVRVPVYAKAVGNALLVAGLDKDFETDLTINEIASNSGVSRSMTIQSLKLLVDLQIFHKREEINKPCTYKFNPGEWLQYSTPEPKQKVVRICGAERVEDTCSPPDTPPHVSINAYPEPLEPGDVWEEPQVEIAGLPVFVEAAAARTSVNKKPTVKPTVWRSPADRASVRYAEVGPIYDEPTGLEIQRRMDEEGLLPQQVVIESVQLSKGFRFLTVIAAVAGDICSRALSAIAAKPKRPKPHVVDLPKQKDKEVSRQQWEEQSLEQWWQENRERYGDCRSYKDLSLLNGCEKFIADPETNLPITISALRERERLPKIQYGT